MSDVERGKNPDVRSRSVTVDDQIVLVGGVDDRHSDTGDDGFEYLSDSEWCLYTAATEQSQRLKTVTTF